VLVIDDDERMRRLVCRALDGQRLEIEEAASGDDGIRRAGAGGYDVILLDLEMPRLDGWAVLDRLLSRRPEETIIVLSGRCDVATVERCLRAGARAFLAKPFSLVDLAERVSECCAATDASDGELGGR
jgi:CheY-like chemotaxis protein